VRVPLRNYNIYVVAFSGVKLVMGGYERNLLILDAAWVLASHGIHY
jgi:hypothetical protein